MSSVSSRGCIPPPRSVSIDFAKVTIGRVGGAAAAAVVVVVVVVVVACG